MGKLLFHIVVRAAFLVVGMCILHSAVAGVNVLATVARVIQAVL